MTLSSTLKKYIHLNTSTASNTSASDALDTIGDTDTTHTDTTHTDTTHTPINTLHLPLPNEIQRLQRANLPSMSSPIDIFERSVQPAAPSPDQARNAASSTQMAASFTTSSFNTNTPSLVGSPITSPPSLASPSRSSSSHILSENFTAPVLDSTVELISNNLWDDLDVVQVPHSHPKLNLFKASTDLPLSRCSSPNTNPNSKRRPSNAASIVPNINTAIDGVSLGHIPTRSNTRSKSISSKDSTLHLGPNQSRKSISFYSYSDLCNYENLTKSLSNLSDQETSFISQIPLTASLKHIPSSRRSTIHGSPEDSDAKIDQELGPDDGASQYSNHSNRSNRSNRSHYTDNDTASVKSWVPENHQIHPPLSTSRSRRQSLVDELASIRSCTTNNSYFEDEFQDLTELNDPLVNVCSASQYIDSRTQELRKCCSGN